MHKIAAFFHITPRQLLTLLAVCLGAVALPLAFTGPAVALPALGRSFGASPLALQWATNAFMLSLGSTLMLAGTLADRYGRRRVFLGGLLGFAITSLGLAAAPGVLSFDLLRAAQGLAGAALFAGGAAALAQVFDGPARMRAFSLLGTSFGAGLAFGPMASGLMIERFGWRSIFTLVAGLSLLAWALGRRSLVESRDPGAARLDGPGALAFTAALGLFTGGLLQAPQSGWGHPLVLALLAGAALSAAAFVAIERRTARPMLDLSLFRYPRFVGVQLLAAAPACAYVVLLVLLPVRFMGVGALSEADVGRVMMALSAPLLVLPVASGLLTRWFSAAALCGTGLLVCAAGLAWLSTTAAGDTGAAVMAPMLLIGLGMSLPWGLIDGLAVSVVPTERAGMATGIFSTVRVASEGLALVSAVLSALTMAHLPAGAASQAAAQQLVIGNLAGAAAALPGLDRSALAQAYGTAFSALLWILCAITVAMAATVLLVVGREAAPAPAPKTPPRAKDGVWT